MCVATGAAKSAKKQPLPAESTVFTRYLAQYKVVALKSLCEQRSLKQSGTKDALDKLVELDFACICNVDE